MNGHYALDSLDGSHGAGALAPVLPYPAAAPDAPHTLADIAARVHTVNGDTGLSTDFLNQYNELSMLLDLAADDPDILEELEDWSPRSYRDHFAASSFKDWALVVAAYDLSPPAVRVEFDAAIDVLNSVAEAGIRTLLESRQAGSTIEPDAVHALAAELQAAIIHASGLINGSHTLGSQAQVDTLFARAQTGNRPAPVAGFESRAAAASPPDAPTDAPAAADGDLLDQDAIDALFD